MEREQLEVDVLFVGAGPANLAGALHLTRLLKDDPKNQAGEPIEPVILVIDKGKEIGSHILSGAVVRPEGFAELLAGYPDKEPPYDCPVQDDAAYILTSGGSWRMPITPPPLRNHGNYVASLGKLVRWMAELCEENQIEVYPEFPAVELLWDGDRVIGVRIGDKGLDHDGNPKANFEPGIEVLAKVTVLGEGVRGTLALQAERKLGLKGPQPQIYAAGVKEIWQVPREIAPGTVYHTLGFPLGTRELGGGFIYTMRGNLVDLGFVVGLDSEDPGMDPHGLFQEFKTHPFVKRLIEGGKPISYGAKAIPEGGYYSMPRLFADGLLMVGDSAGFLDAQRLKGIHLAIKSGMMAAETLLDGLLADDCSAARLSSFRRRFEKSWARDQLWKVRNSRQSFQRGFWSGMLHNAAQYLTGGRGFIDPMPTRAGHERMHRISPGDGEPHPKPVFDGKLTFDKLSDVFLSDTAHEEDQPCHLRVLEPDICHTRCTREYGNPCRHFCPAHVYEMAERPEGLRLQINFTNCVHCKTCDIADPYQVILWTPPEGGGGPDWKNM